MSYPDVGTPQGGVISPLLSNIYLHEVLDKWFVESVQPACGGRTFMVRWADDFVMGFERLEDVRKVQKVIAKRFARSGLKINAEKTRLVRFERPPRGPLLKGVHSHPIGSVGASGSPDFALI